MAPSVEQFDVYNVVVLGAGVIGLTTAIEIQERGKGKYRVTIVSDVFPGDPNTGVNYTSQWAGAHHVYNTRDRKKYPNDDLYYFEKDTFRTLWELSEPGSETDECFFRISETEYFHGERITDNSPGPEPLEEMPMYKPIPPQDLPPKAISGCTFNTVTIDTPIYLNWLFTRFIGRGGRTVRGHVQHLSQIIEGGISIFGDRYSAKAHGRVDAVIVCTGLSTRFMGGVEDMSVYPIRGQTVLLRAPWVRTGITESGQKNEKGEEVVTYIIPRRSGDVVIGGTRVANDWYPHPREETTSEILTRALKLCPQLAPPEVRAIRPPQLGDLLSHVVGEGCGLRPARENGIRIESEWWDVQGKLDEQRTNGDRGDKEKVLVVYNYGHAGYGYQTSWGTARKAADLLEAGFKDI
ncbi:hypothetical protein AGABI2DRAFT_208623 [Agaricus bisporus var. bisporus H97]|uniref:hypothetical protein n=1 Tax=Agaricus bisporus var. bisporus (strain H97 / ATCC MYA-4626 / FGSC 10389) TaxID=936046 RepID=UPI00029F66C7|nr:hypothetical protein AGABI2DRAFT_208623 [Agaricus bisporus var. bisporus H97]EKV44387.1 hypothetical protein AGABI2DRAFT_208623 [Agaricus bisporus var. bisporus H97]